MIYLKDIVDDTFTNASGYSLYVELKPYFEDNTPFVLSFEERISCSTSFLNSSFGQLIEEYGLVTFKKIVSITKVSKSNAQMIRKYIKSFERDFSN